jgi:hypothetical protein
MQTKLRKPRLASGEDICAICFQFVKADEACYDPRRTLRTRAIVHEKCGLFVIGMHTRRVVLRDPLPGEPWVQLSLWMDTQFLAQPELEEERKGER